MGRNPRQQGRLKRGGAEWVEAKVRFGRFGKPINSPWSSFNVNPGCR